MSQSFSNNINAWNTTVNFTVTGDRSDILAWLSPLNPKVRHQDIRDRRVGDVGQWVLQTEEFRDWHAGSEGSQLDNAVLFCYGDPGVGKTFISSLVIDRLCDHAGGRNATVACFYFDFAAQKEQSPTSMLGALLKQQVDGLDKIPAEILVAYWDHKIVIGGRGPQLADIVKMLQITTSRKPTFICIDALDECVAEYRVKLLNSLDRILQKSPTTRIFVTGRAHVRDEVTKCFSGRVTALHVTPSKDDIIDFLHSRLDEDTIPDAMDSSLKADILKKVPEDVSDIFLLVSLIIDAILQETTISCRRRKLNAITDGLGLGGAYDGMLARIKAQGGEKSKLGISTLMWISHSERPLNTDELCHALGVEMGSPDLDAGNVPSIGTLLACCQGLVAVDKKASTVRLIHPTLQEHLRAHPELFGTPHATIAEICLSYLNSHQVKSLPASRHLGIGGVPSLRYSSLGSSAPALGYSSLYSGSSFLGRSSLDSSAPPLEHSSRHSSTPPLECSSEYSGSSSLECSSRHSLSLAPLLGRLVPNPRTSLQFPSPYLGTPFLEYASLYWGMHAKGDLSDCAKQLALKLFDDYGSHVSTKIILHAEEWRFIHCDYDDPSLFSGLHCASFFGIVEIVAWLVDVENCDIDQTDCTGSTPLIWAALNGHEGVVKVLLGRGNICPNKAGRYGETPLWCAAKNGHDGVVKSLLGRGDVNPDKPNEYGETPLWWAAKNGHEGVVKMLLGRDDINPDKPNEYGETPLWWAALNGHEEVVKMLLGLDDVNHERQGSGGRTPLLCALENGHWAVAELLLKRGNANPDHSPSDGMILLRGR